MPRNVESLRCIEVAMGIPLVRSAKDRADLLYLNARSINFLSRFGFFVAESGFGIFVRVITPITGKLQAPLVLVDMMACIVLEQMKSKFPVLSENTDKVMESGRATILESNLCKKTLAGVDSMLGLIEAVFTLVPVLSGEQNDNDSFLVKALIPIRLCYEIVTYPIRLTVNFIQTNRSRIQSISGGEQVADCRIQERRKVVPFKRLGQLNDGIAYGIFVIPRFILQTVGRATCERSELNERLERSGIQAHPDEPDSDCCGEDRNKRKYSIIGDDQFLDCQDDDSGTGSVLEVEVHAENTEELPEAYESADDSGEFRTCSSDTTLCEASDDEPERLESERRGLPVGSDEQLQETSSDQPATSSPTSSPSQYESSTEDIELPASGEVTDNTYC